MLEMANSSDGDWLSNAVHYRAIETKQATTIMKISKGHLVAQIVSVAELDGRECSHQHIKCNLARRVTKRGPNKARQRGVAVDDRSKYAMTLFGVLANQKYQGHS